MRLIINNYEINEIIDTANLPLGISIGNQFKNIALFYPRFPNGKVATTGTAIGVRQDSTILRLMKAVRKENKVLARHCDDPLTIKRLGGHKIEAEVAEVKKTINLAKQVPGVKIIICHVSCRQSAELILAAQQEGMQIAIELCPQYLWFDSDRTNWNPNLDPVFYHCFNMWDCIFKF